jgi:hypothetical protein
MDRVTNALQTVFTPGRQLALLNAANIILPFAMLPEGAHDPAIRNFSYGAFALGSSGTFIQGIAVVQDFYEEPLPHYTPGRQQYVMSLTSVVISIAQANLAYASGNQSLMNLAWVNLAFSVLGFGGIYANREVGSSIADDENSTSEPFDFSEFPEPSSST